MSETTAAYQVKAKSGIMNNNTRNEFASCGLDILKRSVLLVLYEEIDIAKSPLYTGGRILEQGKIREKLGIRKQMVMYSNSSILIQGILADLQTDELVHHYRNNGWQITEKGVSEIEG